ncbi:MAG: hypothetical protein IJ688_10610 [Treponema sp.]|nr:hypothetical protein [Treponema sp.]
MNHKSIICALAAVFSFSLLVSILSFLAKLNLHIEVIFAIFFSIMVLFTIFHFKRDLRHMSQNKTPAPLNPSLKRKNLFLRVSIIAGLFAL